MTQQERSEGAFILWKWGDREIDNPKILRGQLLEIASKGFSGVLIALGATRYEIIDQKVLRAVARVSQWAKMRNLTFWFHADPRQASRTFITKTGERMQNLIVTRKPGDGLSHKKINMTKVVNNRFELRYKFPRVQHSPTLQEMSLHFEPSELERAFLFQKENGTVLRDTIQDITPACHFFTNLVARHTEVFGDILTPEDEEWWVIAFPKFDTNAYDFAGRESNDLMDLFVEDLFDACTHLDGITWGESGAGYAAEIGKFPVSLSLYNIFKIEYGYDLRDVLYGLVLNVDDGLHIRVRCDYYSLLMDTVFGAEKDFHRTIHSFFSKIDIGLHHTFDVKNQHADNLVKGCIDPWRSLEAVHSPLVDIQNMENLNQHLPSFLSALITAKSLGVFSKSYKAFFNLPGTDLGKEELAYCVDMMSLFSIQWLARPFGENQSAGKDTPELLDWKNFEELNRRITLIRRITEFRFPEANVALIFPTETIMAIGSQDAYKIILSVNELISRLTLECVQCDLISTALLKEGRLSPDGLRIRNRMYESVIFPYPEVLEPEVLEIVSVLDKFGYPILLGGSRPQFTTRGKRIPHTFPLSFDPVDDDLTPLLDRGVKPLFEKPENGLATSIHLGDEILFLLCPKSFGDVVKGQVRYGENTFSVPESHNLVIFQGDKNGEVEQIM